MVGYVAEGQLAALVDGEVAGVVPRQALCNPDISGPSFWSDTVTVASSVTELNASSWEISHLSSAGRTATTSWALATSMPTKTIPAP